MQHKHNKVKSLKGKMEAGKLISGNKEWLITAITHMNPVGT